MMYDQEMLRLGSKEILYKPIKKSNKFYRVLQPDN
jgi:hypothetical protein